MKTKQVVLEVPANTNAVDLHHMLGELLASLPEQLRSTAMVQGRITGGDEYWGHEFGTEITYHIPCTAEEEAAERAYEKTLIEAVTSYRAHGDNQSATAASLDIPGATLAYRLTAAAGCGLMGYPLTGAAHLEGGKP